MVARKLMLRELHRSLTSAPGICDLGQGRLRTSKHGPDEGPLPRAKKEGQEIPAQGDKEGAPPLLVVNLLTLSLADA